MKINRPLKVILCLELILSSFFLSAQTFSYQSITLAAWGGTHYYEVNGTGFENIDAIANAGGNITLQTISSINDGESSFISALDDTSVYSDIKKAALYAKSKGLKITLKPHIQMNGGGVLQMYSYSPSDGAAFFNAVEHDLMNNVKLAKEVGAEMLIIGTELGGKISSNHGDHGYDNCSAWHSIIGDIRKLSPSLKLTYAATMTNSWNYLEPNEAPRVCFWDALDFIGFDAYPDMNNLKSTADTVDFYNQMFDNGNPIVNGGDDGTENSIFSLRNFANQYDIVNQSQIKYIDFVAKGIRQLTGKADLKVILTEIGTPSTNDAFNYWGGKSSNLVNFDAQAKGWDGVMRALSTETSIIEGINVWSVNPWHGPADDTNETWKTDWDPLGKPAYNIIKKWFTGTPTIIPNNNQEDQLIIYPNPCRSQFTVKMNQNVFGLKSFIALYDLLGNEILSVPISDRETTISSGSLANGIYLYQIVRLTRPVARGKLIVE